MFAVTSSTVDSTLRCWPWPGLRVGTRTQCPLPTRRVTSSVPTKPVPPSTQMLMGVAMSVRGPGRRVGTAGGRVGADAAGGRLIGQGVGKDGAPPLAPPVAQQIDGDLIADTQQGDCPAQVGVGVDVVTFYGGDHVARMDAG